MATDVRHLTAQDSQTAPPQTDPLEKVVEKVRRDSQVDPDRYIDESAVPHGGE